MAVAKKILFSTVPVTDLQTENGPKGRYINHNDLSQNMTYAAPAPMQLRSFVPANGLRFIKENIPEIDILEYPDWNEFETKLKKGVDILGISFHTYTSPVAEKMINLARSYGVREFWAGNYGVMTPGIEKIFSRTFQGTAEYQIAEILGKKIEKLKHPVIITKHTVAGLK